MGLKLDAEDGTGSVQVFNNAKFTTTVMVDNPHGVAYVALTDEQVEQLHEFTAPKDAVKEDAAEPQPYTLGDITGNDLWRTDVGIIYGRSDIYGKLTDIYYDRDTEGVWVRPNILVTLTVGGITLEDLPLHTECRLIRTNQA